MKRTRARGIGAYALLEHEKVVLGQGIGFGDDGDEIDACSQTLHDLDIQRLQPTDKSGRQLDNVKMTTHVCPVGLIKYKQA